MFFEGKRVAFIGKLGGINRRQAQRLVREQGGVTADSPVRADLLIIGADELPLENQQQLLTPQIRRAAAGGQLEIITETELWHRLGLVENDDHIQRLYTPAMLAQLLGTPVSTIRGWRRRGWITPVCEVYSLPYFDFQEVATARRLAELLSAGVSPAAIEKKLSELAQYVPDVKRPLAQLSVIVEGRSLLLRQTDGLVESGGQRRFDFSTGDRAESTETTAGNDPLEEQTRTARLTADALIDEAVWLEEQGQTHEAAERYRAALAVEGPRADVCFLLAEALYRLGEVGAARERYYSALEIDERFVEARVNLGCLLAETGETELAAAALEGALQQHPDYLDAHYHLARLLDEMGRPTEAADHWRTFLELAPDSPWSEEAARRLEG